ncbi:MAG: HNH endonuclease [Candidatus Woesearchaeota archaeon]
MVRVHLDDGSFHDVTYDHKFIMRDGSEKRADELKKEDSLMPLYSKLDKLEYNNKLPKYEYIFNLNKNEWETTHKVVCESSQRERSKNEVIHHIDFNNLNNNPSNLLLINRKEHIKYHGLHAKKLWEENYDKMHDGILKGRNTLLNDEKSYNEMRQKLKNF